MKQKRKRGNLSENKQMPKAILANAVNLPSPFCVFNAEIQFVGRGEHNGS